MPSFLLNGTGGYIVTENADRIIIDAALDLFDELEVYSARSGWSVWPADSRWEANVAPSRWRVRAGDSRWEVD